MSLDIYSKEPPQEYDFEKAKKRDRAFAILLSSIGFFAIVFAAGPLFIFSLNSALSGNEISEAPIPSGQVLAISDENIEVEVKEEEGFSYFSTNYVPQKNRPEKFYVSIPKLKIENATAKVDNLNFYENLSHFPGTALPGEVGNMFITGHSVLPQFADPKDYHKIFTKLPDLEVGDIINVNFEGKNYKYIVQYSKVVNPKDLSVLKPIAKGSRNLTLMTCVPPGTSLKRMVVVASFAD